MVQKALSLEPQDNEYRLLLAETYCDLDDLTPARTIVQNILKHEPPKSGLRRMARVLLKRIDNKTDQQAVSASLNF
jgi:FimV-like protein